MTSSDLLSAAPTVALVDHVVEINRYEQRLFQSPSGDWWYRNERFSLTRFPNHQIGRPQEEDIRFLFLRPNRLLLDWIRGIEGGENGNAFLYIYESTHYSLESLNYQARRDARRALRELSFRLLPLPELLERGFPVFENTRLRNGLSDGTQHAFRQRFETMTPAAGYAFLGAFRGPELAAFISILSVDDWVSIGPYGHANFRNSCPTDGMVHLVLDYFINTRRVRVVSYGLSSVQGNSSRRGLHEFKIKVGFKAIPVWRCFRPHPLIVPLIKGVGRHLIRWVINQAPSNRMLRKMDGVLRLLTIDNSTIL